MRRLTAVLIILMLILSMTGVAFAQPDVPSYLNLGDSIAFGFSADEGPTYYDLYSEYLWDFGIAPIPNDFAIPGITSWELLDAFTEYDAQLVVSQADVITISIGGNNLLRGMIGAIFEAYELNPMENTFEELMDKIIKNEEMVWNIVTTGLMEQLQDPAPGCPLWMGSNQFVEDWPMILSAIHDINPEAHVIVLNLYNPVSKREQPELHGLLEELLKPMNQVIRQNQGRRSSVANVHNAFARNDEAVKFSVSWFPHLDPHPTNEGHQLIFEELVKSRNPRSFK